LPSKVLDVIWIESFDISNGLISEGVSVILNIFTADLIATPVSGSN